MNEWAVTPNGLYVCKSKWPFAQDVRVVFRQTEKQFILTLTDDSPDYMHIDPPLDDCFYSARKLAIRKAGSKHAVNFGEDYFVLYPYRAGVPFLFELEKEGEEIP